MQFAMRQTTTAEVHSDEGTIVPSHRQVIDRVWALIAALAICGVLGGISLLVPPFIDDDSASGFQAWHGTLLGSPNSVIAPDPANIAHDSVEFQTHWSPGQYLVPGALSLLGLPLGAAMILTVALALLCSLIGWIFVVREFAPNTSLSLLVLVVVLVASFRYSTFAFRTYRGGEILLQAVTPWLILAANRVPEMSVVRAALLAAGAVLVAFMAKITGFIVVAAALMAASLISIAVGRRISHGIFGGAFGAVTAFVVIYVSFFSHASIAPSEPGSFPLFGSIAFSSFVPWVAGISWPELMTALFFGSRDIFSKPPDGYLASIVPPALLIIYLVVGFRLETTQQQKLRYFSLVSYGIVAAVFIVLFSSGALFNNWNLGLEERHFRSVGTLLFVCALINARSAGAPIWARNLFVALCALMAFYGLGSFLFGEYRTAKSQSLDRVSWTNQLVYDATAVEFARDTFAREGRDALFVLPTLPLAVTLPKEARVIAIDLSWESESATKQRRYSGRVPGHILVLLPNSIVDIASGKISMSKGPALLSEFKDYAPDAWKKRVFDTMTVFFQ
jgi:hypothetical protein